MTPLQSLFWPVSKNSGVWETQPCLGKSLAAVHATEILVSYLLCQHNMIPDWKFTGYLRMVWWIWHKYFLTSLQELTCLVKFSGYVSLPKKVMRFLQSKQLFSEHCKGTVSWGNLLLITISYTPLSLWWVRRQSLWHLAQQFTRLKYPFVNQPQKGRMNSWVVLMDRLTITLQRCLNYANTK